MTDIASTCAYIYIYNRWFFIGVIYGDSEVGPKGEWEHGDCGQKPRFLHW